MASQPSPSAFSSSGSATTSFSVAVGGDHVGDVGVGGDGRVGHQRPRGRRPHQQRGLAGERAGGQREADVDRRVDDRLVALRQLVVGQAGAAARAPGGDAVVLDQQALVEDLLERPPDGLDVLGVHGPVGVVQVDPVAHAGRQLGERVGVPGHRLAALGVELGDAVRLDVLLAGEAELLLDGELDGQAVAVPAGLAGHVVAVHRPEAREDVLEDAGLDVVGAGHAVGGRRALVEDPLGAALGLLQALGEDLAARARSRAPRARGRAGRPGRAPGGTAAVCHERASSGGRVCLPSEGREPLRLPRYHPPWPPARYAPVSPLIGVAMPGLLAVPGIRAAFFRRLRGDPSHRARPRALTVPGSLLAAYDATRPHPRLSLRPVYGPRRARPTGFRGPVRRGPARVPAWPRAAGGTGRPA